MRSWFNSSLAWASNLGRFAAQNGLVVTLVVVVSVIYALITSMFVLWFLFGIVGQSGAHNFFIRAFSDERLIASLYTTVSFTGLCLATQLVLALVLLYLAPHPQSAVSVLLFAPALIAPATVATISFIAINPEIGPLHTTVTGPVFSNISFLFGVLLGIDTWQWTTPIYVLLAVRASRISPQQIELASIEGNYGLRRFLTIVLPEIRPLLVAIGLVRFFDLLRIYDTFAVLTGGGGPGQALETVSIYLAKLTFFEGERSYMAALSLVLILSLTVACIALFSSRYLNGLLPWQIRLKEEA